MRIVKYFAVLAVLSFVITGCSVSDNSQSEASASLSEKNQTQFTDNPVPTGEPLIPTVQLQTNFETRSAAVVRAEGTSTLAPDTLTATLKPGESVSEHKTAVIAGAPPAGDLIFSLDLTGSMSGELANVKVNSVNIMNKIKSVIPDMQFAVISHMDYTNKYSGGGYGPVFYGDKSYGDYPYKLNQPLTADLAAVSAAINALKLGSGNDQPEDYTRAMYESYSDPNVGWRKGAKKILLTWGDSFPHDLDYRLDGTSSSGPEPGRDEIAGTADDLNLLNVLQTMNLSNISLIALHSGDYLTLWNKYTGYTGGSAFKINSDGTIPGGQDIGDFIAQKVLENVQLVHSLSLKVVTPGFEGWLTYASPDMVSNVTLDAVKTFEFDIQITVPAGTPDGIYTFDIGVVGDGVIYAVQKVTINVVSRIEVAVDIKPHKIPNYIDVDIDDHDFDHDCDYDDGFDSENNIFCVDNHDSDRCHNIDKRGTIPVAICGTSNFDVRLIDVKTVRLAGVSPVFSYYHDVATPYYPFIDKPLDKMAGNKSGRDGYLDLVMLVKNKELVKSLGDVEDEEVLILKLSGKTLDGRDIVGEDVICVKDRHHHYHHHGHHHNNHYIRWCPKHK